MSWLDKLAEGLPSWLNGANAEGAKPLPKPSSVLPSVKRRPVLLPQPSLNAFRTAVAQARQGNRKMLLGLYDQVVLDAHLASIMQQRTLATLSRPYAVSTDGTPHPEAMAALDGLWFQDFLHLALRSRFYGAGLVQLGPPRTQGGFESAVCVPEALLMPDTGEVEGDGGKRIPYTVAPYADWAVPTGKPGELGLLMQAIPLVLGKQAALERWNGYLELFGMPFRAASMEVDSQEDYDRLAGMLAEMGSTGWAVLGPGEKLEFLPGGTMANNGSGYETLCRFADEQLSKLLLGQTMTTDKGGSLAQAQVHERTGQALFRADALWLEELVNTELLPRMARLGMPVAGARFSFLPDENGLPPELKLELVRTLLSHYRIPAGWIEDEFGIRLEDR